MKKIISLILILTMGLSLFVGCSKEETNNSNQKNKNQPEKENNVIELTLWHYFGEVDGKIFNKYVDEFNKANYDINVKSEYVHRDELMKQYTIGLVGDNLPDIGMIDNPDQAAFIEMGLFYDITDFVNEWGEKDKFFEGPLKSTMKDGRIYGVPHNSNCLALWYDVDMLKEAGVEPPTTWDELEEVATKLTKEGVYGLALSAVKNEEGTFQYLPWLLSSGADIEHLDSEESIKSLSYLTDLIQNGYMSPEVINWTQGDVEKQFVTGKAAMMINGPWNIPAVEEDAPEKNWAVAKVPKDERYSSVLGGENMGIINGISEDKAKAAWEFLKFISTAEISERFNKDANKFSPRSDVMSSSSHWSDDPVLSAFAEQMQYAMPRGPHPRWPEISTAISASLHEAFTGAKTPEQACQAAQQKVSEVLKK